jgi:hypothetical protein
MPNKTIYLKDTDVPLFEQAQEQLGDSVSSIFAEFLRERVAKLTPVESRIIELLNRIARSREEIKHDRAVPAFVDGEYAEAEAFASKALKSLRAGEVSKTKIFFYAANTYLDGADRDLQQARELGVKIAEMLGTKETSKKKPRK